MKILAYLIAVAVCVALAICAGNALANPLTDDFVTKYALGTVEPTRQDAPVRCL